MRRLIFTSVLITVIGLSPLASRVQEPPPGMDGGGPKVAEIEKVKDNLYMITGGGGNTAAFVTDKGVVLVDAKMPGWGEAIQDKLNTVTDKPVTTIIITHSHFDHIGSIDYFGKNVEIVTHENTRTRMKNPNPFKTFKDNMTLFQGKDQIDLYYFGRGHTDGDILVVFKSAGVMHCGDLFAWKQTPILDTQGGSSAVEYGKTLAKAAETIKGVDTVITGHSPLMTFADFKEYADFNNDFIKWVEGRIRAGKSVKEAAAEFKIDPKYEGYSINTFMGGIEGNIQAAYNELQK